MSIQKTKVGGSLSKSRYMRGLQCHKSLWLSTYMPELAEASEEISRAFQQGYNVGELARDLFPGGVLVPYEGLTHNEQLEKTAQALSTAKVIYEAAFVCDGVFVKADILRKVRGGWELYEVKGSSKLKDVHLDDAAVQYHVITGLGIKISKIFVTHFNSSYKRKGALTLENLFTSHDVTEEVLTRQGGVKKEIAHQKRMLKGKVPDIDIGHWCSYPYECDFAEHCWKHIPEESVFDLAGKGVDRFELYGQGIITFKDIPLNLLKGNQLQQVEATLGKKTIVNKKKLHEFLDQLWYPSISWISKPSCRLSRRTMVCVHFSRCRSSIPCIT